MRKLTDLENILQTDTEFCISASLILFMINSHIYMLPFTFYSDLILIGLFLPAFCTCMLCCISLWTRWDWSCHMLNFNIMCLCFQEVGRCVSVVVLVFFVVCLFLFVCGLFFFFFVCLMRCISVTLSSVENCN